MIQKSPKMEVENFDDISAKNADMSSKFWGWPDSEK
jgi:hypothetical protein